MQEKLIRSPNRKSVNEVSFNNQQMETNPHDYSFCCNPTKFKRRKPQNLDLCEVFEVENLNPAEFDLAKKTFGFADETSESDLDMISEIKDFSE